MILLVLRHSLRHLKHRHIAQTATSWNIAASLFAGTWNIHSPRAPGTSALRGHLSSRNIAPPLRFCCPAVSQQSPPSQLSSQLASEVVSLGNLVRLWDPFSVGSGKIPVRQLWWTQVSGGRCFVNASVCHKEVNRERVVLSRNKTRAPGRVVPRPQEALELKWWEKWFIQVLEAIIVVSAAKVHGYC